MSQPEESVLDLLEREIRGRLTESRCESCGRGGEGVGNTALAQLFTGLQRLEIARSKQEPEEHVEVQVNPLSLVATVQKLPVGHSKRGELLEMLRGQIISLQEAERSLREESR